MQAITALAALAVLLPLVVAPVAPLIDFYNHLARFYVLSHLGSDPVLGESYESAWALLPNLGLDFLATPLLAAVPPLAAAKLIIAILLLNQFFGALALNKALHGRLDPAAPLLLAALLHSYVLTWGFANFLLGLGLAFWNAALWLRLRERPSVAAAACGVVSVAIFFCHGLAFATYGLLVGGIELGRWLGRRDRRMPELVRTAGLLLAQAVVPAILFVTSSTAAAGAPENSAIENLKEHWLAGDFWARLAFEVRYRLHTIVHVGESPFHAADLALFAAGVALIGWGLVRGWFAFHRWLWPAAAVFAVLAVLTPPNLFGVGYVPDRIPLVLALVGAVGLSTARGDPVLADRLLIALAVLALLRVGTVTLGWSPYEERYRAFSRVAEAVPRGALVADVITYDGNLRTDQAERCEMYRPLLVVTRGAATPLFSNPTQQPLRQKGRLAEAVERTGRVEHRRHLRPDDRQFDDQLLRLASAGFEYVLVCGSRPLGPLPAGVRPVASEPGFLLLRVGAAPTPDLP